MISGRAFILGGKYPDVVRRSRAKHKALLYQTRDKFLDPKVMDKLLEDLAKDGKTENIELYALWDDGHEFSFKDIPFVAEVAIKLEKLAVTYPTKKFYFAPFLEDRLKRDFKIDLFRDLKKHAPSLNLVNSAIGGGGEWINDRTGEILDELHLDSGIGKPKYKYIVSVDGRADEKKGHGNGSVDMNHEAQVAAHPNCIIWCDWVLQDNGKKNTKDKTKRKDRKSWLTVKMDESVCYLGQDPGEMWLKHRGDLWKSHAEQHGEDPNNPEGNRPVYISGGTGKKYGRITLKDSKGGVIESVTKSVKYKHGAGYVYRFGRWGYKQAAIAKGRAGSPTCFLYADGELIGRFNPGFRIPGR